MQIFPEIRSESGDLIIFISILKTTGYLLLRNEFRSTQEVARQNIQVSFYIRSTGLWPMSLTYANILKYHIQGMPTNIILQVFI